VYLATKTCNRSNPRLLLDDSRKGLGTPITDLCIITGKSKDIQAPVGYTKVEGDLNKGTGGNFVYLCYHRGPAPRPAQSRLRCRVARRHWQSRSAARGPGGRARCRPARGADR
jgi:hypothetical protein